MGTLTTLTDLNERTVWQAMQTDSYPDLRESIPDFIVPWADRVYEDLMVEYVQENIRLIEIFERLWYQFDEHRTPKSRQEFITAMTRICPQGDSWLILRLYDGKSIKDALWQRIRP